jgi:hypothetical protein
MPELVAKLSIVERCQPRLAKAGREHHERPTVTASTNLAQTGEASIASQVVLAVPRVARSRRRLWAMAAVRAVPVASSRRSGPCRAGAPRSKVSRMRRALGHRPSNRGRDQLAGSARRRYRGPNATGRLSRRMRPRRIVTRIATPWGGRSGLAVARPPLPRPPVDRASARLGSGSLLPVE